MTRFSTASAVVSWIFAVYRSKGHRAYGEAVTELQHGLQCATLAGDAGEPPSIIAACLLHDFGHLLHDLGEDFAGRGVNDLHERLGAKRLATWFGPEVVEPIRMHADSKRYLCWKDSDYYRALSETSRRSLSLQGGPMTDAEALEFEVNPLFERAIRVRRYDDLAKLPDLPTPDLETFRSTLESLVICDPRASRSMRRADASAVRA